MFSKRSDGRRIKTIDPLYQIVPFIMKERSDSQVFYEEKIPVDNLEKYIQKKKQDGRRITHMHVVIAAMTRAGFEKPGLNRFIMNGRIYARRKMQVSLAIKKQMNTGAGETTIKFTIKPTDTIFDVSNQISKMVEENKKESTSNITDNLVKALLKLPGVVLRTAVNILMWMDKHNIMPKSIIEASPFHTSLFITNMGSLGIDPVYHHIYNFGTTSIFIAMGAKREGEINSETGKPSKYISFKFVSDERICDGYYYARGFALFRKYMLNPELLEVPSEEIEEDIK